MINMKRISFALTICLNAMFTNLQAQKILGIGDTLPLIQVKVLDESGFKVVPLESFYKDKPVILDFWATWCSACVKTMMKADSVLKKFEGQAGIIPITYEPEKTVRAFIERSKVLKPFRFTYVIADSVLMGKKISFRELPHEVWVGKDGVIKAITYAEEITTENISAFIKNGQLSLPQKKDVVHFDLNALLTVPDNEILYRSVLTKYKEGVLSTSGTMTPAFDAYSTADRFAATNNGILDLFYAAYKKSSAIIKRNLIEVYVKDSLLLDPYTVLKSGNRKERIPYLYCYELKLPEKVRLPVLYAYVMDDLNRLFPFKASIEKRKRVCRVLVNRNQQLNPVHSNDKSGIKWEGGFIKELDAQPLSVLADYLNEYSILPVIDETGCTGSYNLQLSFSKLNNDGERFFDFDTMVKCLQEYGFAFIEEERMVDILVIREKER